MGSIYELSLIRQMYLTGFQIRNPKRIELWMPNNKPPKTSAWAEHLMNLRRMHIDPATGS